MTILEKAKEVIKDNYKDAECGIFCTRNIVKDPMDNLYEDEELTIDICYPYEYFEVFGLSKDEFDELAMFYEDLVGGDD